MVSLLRMVLTNSARASGMFGNHTSFVYVEVSLSAYIWSIPDNWTGRTLVDASYERGLQIQPYFLADSPICGQKMWLY